MRTERLTFHYRTAGGTGGCRCIRHGNRGVGRGEMGGEWESLSTRHSAFSRERGLRSQEFCQGTTFGRLELCVGARLQSCRWCPVSAVSPLGATHVPPGLLRRSLNALNFGPRGPLGRVAVHRRRVSAARWTRRKSKGGRSDQDDAWKFLVGLRTLLSARHPPILNCPGLPLTVVAKTIPF